MNAEFSRKLELLAANKKSIDKAFKFEMGISQVVAGLLLASNGKEADIEKMKDARAILKKKPSSLWIFICLLQKQKIKLWKN